MPRQRTIDGAIRAIVEGFDRQGQYFTKPEVVNAVCSRPEVASVIDQLRRGFPGWSVDQMFVEAVQTRLSSFLQQKHRVTTANGSIDIRLYENYGPGTGPRRWLRLQSMTAMQLRVSIGARRQRIALEQRTVRVYDRLLQLLETRPANSMVADVFEAALNDVLREEAAARP